MRKRKRNAQQERAGILAVEQACNGLDLIWRSILEEDVGVDGTIEIALGEFPTGKIVGVQVKSGMSYVRSETEADFRFYPDKDDLAYWCELSIPLFLLVHHPNDGRVYWTDVSGLIQSREGDPLGTPYILVSKSNLLDKQFEAYLHGRFDLSVYSNQQYADLQRDLAGLVHTDGSGLGEVSISGLDLFVEGLWGLCSKLQFHSSLLSDLIRKNVRQRHGDIHITYTFDREALYPFFTRYFNLLSKHRIALLDTGAINESLYVKLEYPAFIAQLTTNGRRFVDYLQRTGLPNVHDNQFISLSVRPHIQIEVYSSFELVDEGAKLGPYTDVLAIGFNAYLDYYHLEHWHRAAPDNAPVRVADQNIYYQALKEYIANRFQAVPKNNLWFRYLDIPLTPLICWLEKWNENPQTMPTAALQGKSAAELVGFADEFMAVLSPAGSATITEPPDRRFPIPVLANGEVLKVVATAGYTGQG